MTADPVAQLKRACHWTYRYCGEEHPLAAAMVLGTVARLLAATVGMSFHARDDYFHVLEPALRWLQDPQFDWDHSDLPGAGIRSHLLPRLVWLLLKAEHGVGITDPSTCLQIIYAVIGAYSLVLIPAAWALGRRLLDTASTRRLVWLCALFFAMPYAGTRLLIESLAMPPLVYGLAWAVSPNSRRLFFSGLWLGLACWFRFQVGVAALGVAVFVGWSAWQAGGGRRAGAHLAALAAGGLVALGLQGSFDWWTTGDFLGPVWRNIAVNLHPHAGLSRSSPIAYLGIILLLTVPPATVVLIPLMVRAGQRLMLVTWPFVLFVVFHSLVPHKEERFLLPVLPLFLVLLAAAPAELGRDAGRLTQALRRWWPMTRAFLGVALTLMLALVVTNRSQANLRLAMVALHSDTEMTALVSLGPEVQEYFLERPDLPIARKSTPEVRWLSDTLSQWAAQGIVPNRFLSFAPDDAKVIVLLAALGYACDPPQLVEGWWLDRWLFRFNPERNRRRAPVLIWSCSPRTPAAPA
jgi:hypothetical protein